MRRTFALSIATVLVATATAACGDDTGSPQSGTGGGDRLDVTTASYPLEFAIQQVGGEHVRVTNLVAPGAEPHDLELTPKDVAKISDAKLLVYQKGIAGAVDEAAKNQSKNAFDVTPAAQLDLRIGEGDGHDHEAETGGKSEQPGTKGVDPHFWLEPARYVGVANAIAARLASADPANKAAYERNAKTFASKLRALERQLTGGLANCKQLNLVTSHAAFGYLARRVGFTQVPIAGVSPNQEPDAAVLGHISTLVKKNRVTTVYTEVLADPSFARAVARSSGAKTAVLDPVEGITKASAGKDYFEVMRANLATLKRGQQCS